MSTVLSNNDPKMNSSDKVNWSYEEAFSRNLGIFTKEEQETLRNSRVAIIGMGGVGGVHLMTLTRLGIGKFTIALRGASVPSPTGEVPAHAPMPT